MAILKIDDTKYFYINKINVVKVFDKVKLEVSSNDFIPIRIKSKHIYLDNDKNKLILHGIDIMKYICSIFIVIIHTSPLLPFSEVGNFIIMNIFARFAVPFFFICSGYFVNKNVQKKGEKYFKQYIISLIKTYLIWSILYIPCGILWLQETIDLPIYLYPVALLIAIFYTGTYYPLWYMPALILSLIFVYWYNKYFNYRSLMAITFIFLCIGTLETYYGVINNSLILSIIDNYIKIFFTTRNALFFGIFYVACGFYLAQERCPLKIKYSAALSFLFFLLTISEAFRLFNTNYLNFNFLFMTAPFTICFFEFLKELKLSWNLNYKKIQEYQKLYYFTHGFFLVLIPKTLSLFHRYYLYENNGVIRFVSVMFFTHLLSNAIYHYNQR